MKKIIFVLTFILLIALPVFAFAADRVVLGEWNFEYTAGDIGDYFRKDGRITTSTTNYAVKNYCIDYVNNSHAFSITGYTEAEMSSFANRSFKFKFDEYSLEKYPDTKLVVMFDQQVTEKGMVDNYAFHSVSGSDGTYLSMFLLQGISPHFSNPRPNNNGSGSIKVPKGYKDKIIYVFDFENRVLSYTSNKTTKSNLPFYGNSAGNKADTLGFNVTKGEKVNIDNIEIFAMPLKVDVLTTVLDDFYFNTGKTTVEFNSPLKSVKASIWKNSTKISDCTVNVNGRFAEIAYSNLNYGENYTLKITEATSVAGTTLDSEKSFTFSLPLQPATVTKTNATDGYNPFEKLYFEFDRKIIRADVSIKADGIDFTDFDVDTSNGIEINYTSEKIIPFDSEVNIEMLLMDKNGVESLYTYDFKTKSPTDVFEVFQQSRNIAQAGMGGFSIVASFESDSPGWVYFERDTIDGIEESDLPFEPATFIKVVDPDGNTHFVSDITKCKNGKSGFAVKIDSAKSGIWQFQIAASRNNDIIGIGLENADIWGVRGECILGITENTLKEGYIYVPEKSDRLIAGSSVATDKFTLTDELGNVYNSESKNYTFGKSVVELEGINAETIYKVNIADGFYGGFSIDRAPSLITPTKEMAYALKGGWIETEGILCQGTIQRSARLEAIRLLETKNLDVSLTRPALPSVINYPMAEAQLFSPYGLITPLGHQMQRQILDPTSPYFGNVFDEGAIPSQSWEKGDFTPSGNDSVFGNVVSLDAQLNYFYNNEALANRAALMILGTIAQMSEDSYIREGDNSLHYPTTHGNFYFHWTSEGYEGIRHLLDEETKRVIDNGLEALADKQGTFRGMNTTNQWFFTVAAVDSVARTAGEERHHELFKNHINSLYTNDVYKQRLGQATSGYFVEGYGCDGQYHNLCQLLLYVTYRNYREWQGADKVTVKQFDEIVGKNVEFNSLFWMPQPTTEKYPSTNCFTSRTETGNAITTHTNFEIVTDLFPLAKRRLETSNMPASGLGSAGTFSCLVTNDEWAMRVIKKYYSGYQNYTKNYNSHGSIALYNAFKNQYTAQSTLLPCEQEKGIWDKNGIIAVKHKGIYFNVFYTFEDETSLPAMSFMGGGMTNVWSKGTGTVVASRKPVNYSSGVKEANQIQSSCIYGTDSSGKFFASGKEMATLKWIEKDKIFEISGTLPDKNINVIWRYELTDNGVRVTAKANGDVSDNLWVNIPLVLHEPSATVTYEKGKISENYFNNSIVFSTENETDIFENGSMRNFRVKLQNGAAVIDIEEAVCSKVSIEKVSVSGNDVTVNFKSETGKTETVTVIVASYKNDGTLIDAQMKDCDANYTQASSICLPVDTQDAEYVKAFIWKSLDSMIPYTVEKYPL